MLISIALKKGKKEFYEGVRRVKIGRNHVKLVFWKFWRRKPIYYNRDEFIKAEVQKAVKLRPEDVSVRIT